MVFWPTRKRLFFWIQPMTSPWPAGHAAFTLAISAIPWRPLFSAKALAKSVDLSLWCGKLQMSRADLVQNRNKFEWQKTCQNCEIGKDWIETVLVGVEAIQSGTGSIIRVCKSGVQQICLPNFQANVVLTGKLTQIERRWKQLQIAH